MNQLANETLDQNISAYVDGALSGRELASFEALLAGSPELAEQIEITRLVRQTARELPAAKLPRSFTLPPNTKPALSFWQRLFGDAAQAQKVMRFGSAIATALFVFFGGMGLLNANAPAPRPPLAQAAPTSTSISLAAVPALANTPEMQIAKAAPPAAPPRPQSGGGLGMGGLGGGGSPGEATQDSPDVVPTNAPLPTALPSPTSAPTPMTTPQVSVPVAHTPSLAWGYAAAALASLAAALALGWLGWLRR